MPTTEQLYAKAAEKQQNANMGLTGRPFSAVITSVNPNTEAMDVRHAYGKHSIRVVHPYVSEQSWHRVGAGAGQRVLMHIRMDTKEPAASSYVAADGRDDTPERRITAYEGGTDLYRPLALGEQEIASSGIAQIFAGRRAVLDMRGGYVRSWHDQDAMEAGARAVTHVRELHLNAVGEVGDEERFGGVTRPDTESKVFRKIVEAPAGLPSLPNPQINASALSDPVGTVTSVIADALPDTEPAKELMYVLKTSSGTVIDHREGHVTNDAGELIDGKIGKKLRYRKKIYGAAQGSALTGIATRAVSAGSGSETYEEQVDEDGNYYIGLPQTASTGIQIEIPGGKFHVKAGTASAELTFDQAGTILMKASQEATLRGESGLKLHSSSVKIGQTDTAINKVYSTTVKKAAQSTLHGTLTGSHLADSLLHTADGAACAALAVVNAAAMACPLTPGVVVGLLGMAHSIIPVVMRATGTALKAAKSVASGAYVGTQDSHESNTVSISS